MLSCPVSQSTRTSLFLRTSFTVPRWPSPPSSSAPAQSGPRRTRRPTSARFSILLTKVDKQRLLTDLARKVDVTLAGVAGNKPVKCSRDVTIVPDTSLESALTKGPYDAIVCPGGAGGAKILSQSPVVGKALQDQESRGGIIGAVCAAPTALAAHGIGKGKKVTSYPSMGDKMKQGGYRYLEDRVVQDGKLITSRGPGTCFEFALKLVEALVDKEKSKSLIEPMLIKI